jgi:F-type H+-transporting ATPase subunit epsilon
MQLLILSRNKKLFEGIIHSITLPGANGSFQVLKDHAPLISTLTQGKIVYMQEAERKELTIEQGIVSVHNNKVTALVEVYGT